MLIEAPDVPVQVAPVVMIQVEARQKASPDPVVGVVATLIIAIGLQ